MTNLTITLKKADNCWLAKFSDEPIQEFFPTAYTEKAPPEKVIAGLLKIPLNSGAEFIIES